MLTWSTAGPNAWKVALLCEELGVPYTTIVHLTAELKQPEYLAINRNGMSPVIEDPNTNLVLAEVNFPACSSSLISLPVL